MQNRETEPRRGLPEGVPECTPSGELHPLCAVYRAVLFHQGAEKTMHNQETEPAGVTRSRTACTASGEVH